MPRLFSLKLAALTTITLLLLVPTLALTPSSLPALKPQWSKYTTGLIREAFWSPTDKLAVYTTANKLFVFDKTENLPLIYLAELTLLNL